MSSIISFIIISYYLILLLYLNYFIQDVLLSKCLFISIINYALKHKSMKKRLWDAFGQSKWIVGINHVATGMR